MRSVLIDTLEPVANDLRADHGGFTHGGRGNAIREIVRFFKQPSFKQFRLILLAQVLKKILYFCLDLVPLFVV
jgi:hypothetical protein